MWQSFTERADREGWPAARLLATLTELELAERDQRRIQRHLIEARLPPGKTLDSFDFAAVPMLSRAHVAALATGDGWIDRGGTILLFGPSGSGKSHLSAAFGHALIENGYRVLFTRTTDLVQRLQQARQALSLESAIEKLDKYHLLILEDLCYVRKDQAETSVLFELIAARYERRSLIVTANHPFGEWTSVFPDAAMTLAAVDRLVHHSTIFEMNVESYRRRVAAARTRASRGASATARATASERTGLATAESPQPLASVFRHVTEYRGEFSSTADDQEQCTKTPCPAHDASQGALGDSKSDTRRSARSLKIRSSPLPDTILTLYYK